MGKATVRLRHWQAAATVALMLTSVVNQSRAEFGIPQQAATPPQQAPAAAQQGAQAPAQTANPTGDQVNPRAAAQPAPVENDTTGTPGLPQAPAPKLTEPLFMRPTGTDYQHPHSYFPYLRGLYFPRNYPAPRLTNTPKLRDLLRDGKIFLSLSDAVTLALENNYDIAIARINLDIADTDTLGGTTSTITSGGGPGGTTSSTAASTGSSGLVLSTNGGGPTVENLDPFLTGTLQYESSTTPQTSSLITGTNTLTTHTATYNAEYQQGFTGGEALTVTFDNTRQTTNSVRSSYSPLLQSSFRAQLTQHLLQGFGPWINTRFIVQAKNDRRITDSSFRQQVIYTVTQVESIYWALVSAYEDDQAKQRALQQSTQLALDNRKQLQIGTLAPLDVVNSDSAVSTDRQALVSSESNLEYQQLLMKQAIARDLNDPQLANAPVVPTDRVGLDKLPEEGMKTEDLVRQAYQNNPQVEQASLSLANNKITIRAEKNGLLPVVDAYAFYGGSGVGGVQNPQLVCGTNGVTGVSPCPPPGANYGGVLQNTFDNNSPDYGVGVNLTIPLRNRAAQADQVRSVMEQRQAEMRLQQLYVQIRIQVINGIYALTNDRASVTASQAARDYASQAVEAEQKKYRLGASTTANVLQQERNLATAENTLNSAMAAYARDRSALSQILSNTLDKYNISLSDAVSGTVTQQPSIPGLTAPKAPEAPRPLTATPPPLPQQ
jgi:outer membrane protein